MRFIAMEQVSYSLWDGNRKFEEKTNKIERAEHQMNENHDRIDTKQNTSENKRNQ